MAKEADKADEFIKNGFKDFFIFLRSINGWQNGEDRPIPPKSELPECIKKRIRWVWDKCNGSVEITFSDIFDLVLPDTAKEKELKDKYLDYWLPIGDDYRQFFANFDINLLDLLEKAVAVALVYGLNDEED